MAGSPPPAAKGLWFLIKSYHRSGASEIKKDAFSDAMVKFPRSNRFAINGAALRFWLTGVADKTLIE
jgi:hypothetical protein